MKSRKFLILSMAVLLIVSLFAGCGAAPSESYNGVYDSMEMEKAEANMTIAVSEESGTAALPENQKLIRTIRINAETEALDDLLTNINARITELEGYIQEQSIYNGSAYSSSRSRSANMVIRIPAKRLDEFVGHVSEVSNVTSKNETTENITLSYVAVESRIKALETEEARLLELLAMAETMEDLLKIESRLTEVRTDLEQVKSQLRVYDNQVDYGTIHLSIDEVRDYTVVEEPKGFFERIGTGMVNGFKNMGIFLRELVIFLIVAIPYLILPAGIVVLIVILAKRKKKKQAQPPATE